MNTKWRVVLAALCIFQIWYVTHLQRKITRISVEDAETMDNASKALEEGRHALALYQTVNAAWMAEYDKLRQRCGDK